MSDNAQLLAEASYDDAYEGVIFNVYAKVEVLLNAADHEGIFLYGACEAALKKLYAIAPVQWDHAMVDAFSDITRNAHDGTEQLYGNDGTRLPLTKLPDRIFVEFFVTHLTLQAVVENYAATLEAYTALQQLILTDHTGLIIHNPTVFAKAEVNARRTGLYAAAETIHNLYDCAAERADAYRLWSDSAVLATPALPDQVDFTSPE